MLRTAICNVCNKEFKTSRSHTRACGSKCRNTQWRLSKAKVVSVKLEFTTDHYRHLRKQADANGVSINQYAYKRVMSNEGSQC